MGWKKVFEIKLWKVIISLILILLPWILASFVGTCAESNPPQCTDKFTEFFLGNRWFQFLILGIVLLSLIWFIGMVVNWLVNMQKDRKKSR
jgi:hypothetical protein